MREMIKKYGVTATIMSVYILAMLLDLLLRVINGSSLMDLILGANTKSGLFELIWFQKSKFVSGEYWRLFTWPLHMKSLIHYVVGLSGLTIILAKLETLMGKKILVVSYIGLQTIFFFMPYAVMMDTHNSISINYGTVGGAQIVFAMAGLLLTLLIINNIKESDVDKSLTAFVIATLFFQFVSDTKDGYGQYIIFYAYSFGVLGALIYNRSQQHTFGSNQLAYSKISLKEYPFTLAVFIISMALFVLNSVIIDQSLLDEYNNGSWFDLFISGGDYGVVASSLLCHTEKIWSGQVWRMVTHVFSHMGLIHMLTNMPVLLFAGKIVEDQLGSLKTALIYLGSALSLSSLVLIEGHINTTMGGSSLGLYALMAAYFILAFRKGNDIKARPYEMIYIFAYFILGNFPSIGTTGEGHLTSFMTGIVVIGLISLKPMWYKRNNIKNVEVSYETN